MVDVMQGEKTIYHVNEFFSINHFNIYLEPGKCSLTNSKMKIASINFRYYTKEIKIMCLIHKSYVIIIDLLKNRCNDVKILGGELTAIKL